MLDDNRKNVTAALKLPSPTRCLWGSNGVNLHYECHVLQCEMSWTPDYIRIVFDARGERDLRLPSTSSLALQHAPGIPPRGGATDQDAATLAVVESLPSEAWQTLSGVRPTRELMVDVGQGHYRGMLEWGPEAVQGLRTACNSLTIPPAAEQGMTDQGTPFPSPRCSNAYWRLAFCYACDLGRRHYTDYVPVTLMLASVPHSVNAQDMGAPLMDCAWRERCTYVRRGTSEDCTRRPVNEEQDKITWRAALPRQTLDQFDDWWRPSQFRHDAAWRNVLTDHDAWILGHEFQLDDLALMGEAPDNILALEDEDEDEEQAEVAGWEDQAWEWHIAGLLVVHDDDQEDEGQVHF